MVFKQLAKISNGCIQVYYCQNLYHFGNTQDSVVASLQINDEKFFKLLVFKGHLGFAEAYAKQYCSTSELTEILSIFARNLFVVDKAETRYAWVFNKGLHFFDKILAKNTLRGSKQNISAHYDLGNDLFETFLDDNLQYSSALYAVDGISLEKAQILKMQTIVKRLNLSCDDHLLEIGTGWGGLAIFIAKNIGCKITTITISKEQFEYAKNQIIKEDLMHLISIKLCDYRELTGNFDKIVSIEMIEAVGEQYYQKYFDICAKLLKTNGLFLMQAILIADHKYIKAKNSVDFIKYYIFPGSNIPCLNGLNECANIANMRLDGYFDMTGDYVKTLKEWQTRFNINSSKLAAIGYDQYFQNIWNFYFSYCQAGFIVEHIRDAHLIFKKLC